jgi:hypothetical protein
MTRALPQAVALESENVTTTALHKSLALARPVLLVEMFAGHSSVIFAGQKVMVGGVVSRTVMVCVQLAALPQASNAVQRRLMVYEPPQPGVIPSELVIV